MASGYRAGMKRRRGRDRGVAADSPAVGDLDDPGGGAARARVDVLLDRLARIDLQVAVVAPPDSTRLAARERAQDAAIAHGRKTLLDEAAAAAREMALRAFARSGFTGTWAFTEMAVSVATARDRVSTAATFEEAAMAAVVEDIVGDETVDVLRSTSNELANLTGVVPAGSIAAVGSPGRAIGGPLMLVLLGALAVAMFALGLGTASLVTMAFAIAFLVGLLRRRQIHP
jgi:hypothetical protein